LKLNLGSWKKPLDSYLNCDLLPYEGVDLTFDIRNRFPLGGDIFDEVKISHTLEHVEDDKIRFVLGEIRRVLKRGGLVDIEVPDFSVIIKEWAEATFEERWIRIFQAGNYYPPLREYIWGVGRAGGGQCHLTGFDSTRLVRSLEEVGFREVEAVKPKLGYSIRFQGRKPSDKD